MLRGRLNGLALRAKGYAKGVETLVNPLALAFCDKLKLNGLNFESECAQAQTLARYGRLLYLLGNRYNPRKEGFYEHQVNL